MGAFQIHTHCSIVYLNLKKSDDMTCGLTHCYPEENISFLLVLVFSFEKLQRFVSSLLKIKICIHFKSPGSLNSSCAHPCFLSIDCVKMKEI